ncbi:hypothetical protein DV515_00018309 [Chloebia gouldiae]|uniref:Uncharacterized protein n=1 Tax=Chloebia gouldiae TaxID=44316 RepID=A0A3L8Q7V0_CHLGU|nr:hypothetical protein DV515_00018305 [Chloebia gouldiae]RLV63404.1 hypothetical protein DV515_00018309 [Chloebia gouldiae]
MWDVGMLDGVAGSGRGNFPSLGCLIPVRFRENQALGMSPECHRNVFPNSERDSKGTTKTPRNEDPALGIPPRSILAEISLKIHLKMLDPPENAGFGAPESGAPNLPWAFFQGIQRGRSSSCSWDDVPVSFPLAPRPAGTHFQPGAFLARGFSEPKTPPQLPVVHPAFPGVVRELGPWDVRNSAQSEQGERSFSPKSILDSHGDVPAVFARPHQDTGHGGHGPERARHGPGSWWDPGQGQGRGHSRESRAGHRGLAGQDGPMGGPMAPQLVKMAPQLAKMSPPLAKMAPQLAKMAPCMAKRAPQLVQWPHNWPRCPHGWPRWPHGWSNGPTTGQDVPMAGQGVPMADQEGPTAGPGIPTLLGWIPWEFPPRKFPPREFPPHLEGSPRNSHPENSHPQDLIWEPTRASLGDFPPCAEAPTRSGNLSLCKSRLFPDPGQTTQSAQIREGSTDTIPNLFIKARGIPDWKEGHDPRRLRDLGVLQQHSGCPRGPDSAGGTPRMHPELPIPGMTSWVQDLTRPAGDPFPKTPRDHSWRDRARRDPAFKGRRSPEGLPEGLPEPPRDPTGVPEPRKGRGKAPGAAPEQGTGNVRPGWPREHAQGQGTPDTSPAHLSREGREAVNGNGIGRRQNRGLPPGCHSGVTGPGVSLARVCHRTGGVIILEVSLLWGCHHPGGVTILEVSPSWRCHHPGGVTVLEVSLPWRCHRPGGVTVREVSLSRRCHHPGDVTVPEVSPSWRCHWTGGVTIPEVSPSQGCHSPRGVTILEVSLDWGCHQPGGGCHHPRGVTTLGVLPAWRCHCPGGVTIPGMSQSRRCHHPRDSRRCHHPGDVTVLEVSPSQGCHSPGGVTIPGVSQSQGCHHPRDVTVPEVSPSQGCHHPRDVTVPEVSPSQGCHSPRGVTIPGVSPRGRAPGSTAINRSPAPDLGGEKGKNIAFPHSREARKRRDEGWRSCWMPGETGKTGKN